MSDDEALLRRLDCVGERKFTVTELSGGLTNRNLHVRTEDGGDYVVRLAAANAGLLAINRDHEYRNSVAAAQAGVGAPVIDYRPDLGILVVGFLTARTFSPEDLRSGEQLGRIAGACRQLHNGPRFTGDFNMFRIQEGYLQIVQERGFRLPPRYEEFGQHVARIEAAFAENPQPTVPCNNDLLAENFLDDGEKLWLIDYEYSGNNEATFELGNVWSESGLSLDQLEELVEHYYGAPRPDMVARARLWGLMSKYGWTLWASIQDAEAEIDFDFWGWGMEKYDRAVAEFDGPEYGRLLAIAAGV
jgi:thiamine kinase-like enzyme